MTTLLPLKTELEQRGLLYQYTDDALFELYDRGGQTFYFGMDPTADSLHLGNFVNFMNAVHLMRRGNICIPLVGGATGMIGDPGGKDSERSFLSDETLTYNVAAIQTQINTLLTNIRTYTQDTLTTTQIVNNKDFYEEMSFLQFLRDVGKYMTVNSMSTRETVKKRLTDPDKSISYTEFSYMLIQGYDFVRLYEDMNCNMQISGSDQRGNVTAGIELIRKKLGKQAYGMTCPLILDSTGKKFGKSEGNAIWLDRNKTTSTQMYQYFVKVQDSDVERFLRLFTFLTLEEISSLIMEHNKSPELRIGQKNLAYLVVQIIHGTMEADKAILCSDIMYSDDRIDKLVNMNQEDINLLFDELGGYTISESDIAPHWLGDHNSSYDMGSMARANYTVDIINNKFKGEYLLNTITLYDFLIKTGLADSKGQAKNLVLGGGIYWNGQKKTPENTEFEFLQGKNRCVGLLKKGNNFKLILMP